MADMIVQVLVSPFLQLLFDNLNVLIQRGFSQVQGVNKEMEKLSSTLSTIQAVLADAEEKQLKNIAIRNWLKKLKDAAYDADDALDEYANESQCLASERKKKSCINQVPGFFSSCLDFDKTMFHSKMGKIIKELRERFDEIAKERSNFHLQEGVVEGRVGLFKDRRTSSKLTDPLVLGRDEDKENVLRLLLNNVKSEECILSVCPILGIGGIGKTTLAQLIYNEDRVKEQFAVRIWVCITEDFDLVRIMKTMIESLSGSACNLEDLDVLQLRLEEELSGKTFLLVLDDLWNENQEEWNRLKCSLMNGAKGSLVVVTTRLKTVASITGTLPPYCLGVLSEDDCLTLFKSRAFGLGNEIRPDLVEIGQEIVKKCGGLPLAAKALGGLLRFKSEETEWLAIQKSEIWELPQSGENNILPALRLSYNHLPLILKQCFVYCSTFPRGYEIQKEKLIHLWMANGLVRTEAKMELEDAGNEIFNALLWRSFFQDIKEDKDGGIEKCKMHDLVHDLACHIAVDECFALDVSNVENITRRVRHVSVDFNNLSPSIIESLERSSPCLRSLILLDCWSTINNSEFVVSCFIRLRALDMSSASIEFIPNSIGKMKHLRYLNLSNNPIKSLPESMCELKQVQTLKLGWCIRLESLPKDMRKMSSLRHLDIQRCVKLMSIPIGIGQLTCLQTLSSFIVGFDSGCGIEELCGLNLGGELEIKGLENVRTSMDAKAANLMKKKNLRSLKLSWSIYSQQSLENARDVIEGLQPHPSVRHFSIEGYCGVTFPNWFTASSLPNLVDVSLSECRIYEHLPQLGKLPLLKVLKIESLEYVKFIDGEVSGEDMVNEFPSLEELNLFRMPNLEGWSRSLDTEAAQLLPCLKSLILKECPKLTQIPLSSSQVQSVHMNKCNETVLESLQNLPCLSSLEIWNFNELVSFPKAALKGLTDLKKLDVYSCPKLKTLPAELESLTMLTELKMECCKELVTLPDGLKNLSSLKSLDIRECAVLKCLPELEKSSLTDLRIKDCPELEFSVKDFENLAVLQTLILDGLPKLTCFPEGIKGAVMLQHLAISRCSEDVMDLPEWIGSLTSLQKLWIGGCKNRKFLPEGLQYLTALRTLEIYGCNAELQRGCDKEKGKDWFKISHVPLVVISTVFNIPLIFHF